MRTWQRRQRRTAGVGRSMILTALFAGAAAWLMLLR